MTSERRLDTIEFRPPSRVDLPVVFRWLSDPDVWRWYSEGALPLRNVERQYAPGINGADPVDQYIVRIEGGDAGFIQAYVIENHPNYARQFAVEPGAVGIDLFIGDPAVRLGSTDAAGICRANVIEVAGSADERRRWCWK